MFYLAVCTILMSSLAASTMELATDAMGDSKSFSQQQPEDEDEDKPFSQQQPEDQKKRNINVFGPEVQISPEVVVPEAPAWTSLPDQPERKRVVAPAQEAADMVNYRNCSAAKLTSRYLTASCKKSYPMAECNSKYMMLKGVKSGCFYNEANESCLARGPFCCHSKGTSEVCSGNYLSTKYPSQVLLCGDVNDETKCKKSFSKVRVDGDKDLVTICAWESATAACKGHESPASTVACCYPFDY